MQGGGTGGLREKVRSVTEEMAASASSGDWGRAQELADLRLNLLEALFAQVQDPREEVALIQQILSADRELKSMAMERRAEVVVELSRHRQRSEAARSYLDAASTAR